MYCTRTIVTQSHEDMEEKEMSEEFSSSAAVICVNRFFEGDFFSESPLDFFLLMRLHEELSVTNKIMTTDANWISRCQHTLVANCMKRPSLLGCKAYGGCDQV